MSNPPANASSFLVVGERTNITGSPRFAKAIKAGDWDAALAIARQQVESGANVLDINVDEGLIDSEATMAKFLNLIAAEPEISRIPVMVDSRPTRACIFPAVSLWMPWGICSSPILETLGSVKWIPVGDS